jgi:hypothetical protein
MNKFQNFLFCNQYFIPVHGENDQGRYKGYDADAKRCDADVSPLLMTLDSAASRVIRPFVPILWSAVPGAICEAHLACLHYKHTAPKLV